MDETVADVEQLTPWVPLFVEVDGGFTLTDHARAVLEAMDAAEVPLDSEPVDGELPDRVALADPSDPSDPTEPVDVADRAAPTALQRLAELRAGFAALVALLPAATRSMEWFDLLDATEALQQTANTAAACDQAIVAALDRGAVHTTAGATSTADLLVQYLHLRPAEAAQRVGLARRCAERVTLDGQVLPPIRPQVAAAQASGTISADHAAVIDRSLTWLPVGLPTDTVDAVEASLTELAGKRHAGDVARAGRYARDVFDPDGPEPRDARQRRLRGVRLTQRDDGTGVITGELTATLLAKLQAVLSPLAAPRPVDGHGDDTRSPGARVHDALEEVCDRLLRSGTLPDSGGCSATVSVTIPFSQVRAHLADTPTGRVRTDLGVDLSVPQLLHLACEAEIIPVVLNDAGGVMSHGRTKRFATAAQTRALRARDRGCSFPGCRRPPPWCERHHVEQWLRDHGDTDIDTMTLLCGYHHASFEQWGWDVTMRDGVPWWTPPAHLDPDRTPVRNHAHHLDLDFDFDFATV